MWAYLKFELRRMLREPGILVFTVLMPVASYVVFTGFGDLNSQAEGIPVAATIMVGIAGYGAIIGVLSLGGSVAVERTQGWLRQLRVTPLRPRAVVAVKAFTSTLIAIPSIISVGIAGAIEHHIHLPVSHWVLILAVMWVGTVPFALLGLALGYAPVAEGCVEPRASSCSSRCRCSAVCSCRRPPSRVDSNTSPGRCRATGTPNSAGGPWPDTPRPDSG